MADELARRDFLKTTGVVVVGFSIADKVAAQAPGDGSTGIQRGLVSGPPDPGQVDSYIAIHPDNTATLYTGYVELGQGGPTALRQIAAEELDLDMDQVKDVRVDTFVSTNGFTAASRTAAIGGTETRAAAAEARRALLEMASDRLKTPVRDLVIAKGVVSVRNDSRRSVTYADLVGGKPFNRKFEQVSYNGGIELPRKSADTAIPKRREDYRVVGTRVPRPDIVDKVRGTFQYVQQVRVPGMLHGRVVWPRGQGASGISHPTVLRVDETSIRDIPGVQIVRRGDFVGVVAQREWDAVRAARQLKSHGARSLQPCPITSACSTASDWRRPTTSSTRTRAMSTPRCRGVSTCSRRPTADRSSRTGPWRRTVRLRMSRKTAPW